MSREAKDMWRLASILDILAHLLHSEVEHARAEALTEEWLTLQRKLGKTLNMRRAWARMKRNGWPGSG